MKKAILRPFPYRAYVSHKKYSPNLTQKVKLSNKGLVAHSKFLTCLKTDATDSCEPDWYNKSNGGLVSN